MTPESHRDKPPQPMSHRLTIAILTGSVLLLLLAWQEHRVALVRNCVQAGGLWDGPTSKCRPAPVRIQIEKDLKRS